jgi:hypothetical protein
MNVVECVNNLAVDQAQEQERLFPVIGPGSYEVPDPWKKSKEKVCGINRYIAIDYDDTI